MSRKDRRGNGIQSRALMEMRDYEWKWLVEIESLALSRFKWTGLPETMSERYLEKALLYYGCAVVFDVEGIILGTKLMTHGDFNVYGDPIDLSAIGENGWQYELPTGEGIVVWDSMTRKNKFQIFRKYATELAEIDIQARTNRRQQKNLSIITGPKENQTDLINLERSMEMNENVIIALDTLNSQVQLNVLKTEIPYLQKDFNEDKNSTLNRLYNSMGIQHIPVEKTERLVAAEAEIATDSVSRIREDALIPRRLAAKEISEMYGINVSVEWRMDEHKVLTADEAQPEENGDDNNG